MAAARAEGPPPERFGRSPLPAFTASGLDPAQLAALPWPLRRPVAESPTLAGAYELVERYTGPGADAGVLALRFSRANQDYVAAMG